MINFKVKMKLDFPDLQTQEQLEEIANKVIVPDIQARINAGVDLSDSPHKPNATATRLAKGLRGLRTDVPLIASGQLQSSFRVNLVGRNAVSIAPRGLRQPYPPIPRKRLLRKSSRKKGTAVTLTNTELAEILQIKGVRGHKYEFFGISERAERGAIKFMIDYIEEAIKRGGRKTIR